MWKLCDFADYDWKPKILFVCSDVSKVVYTIEGLIRELEWFVTLCDRDRKSVKQYTDCEQPRIELIHPTYCVLHTLSLNPDRDTPICNAGAS